MAAAVEAAADDDSGVRVVWEWEVVAPYETVLESTRSGCGYLVAAAANPPALAAGAGPPGRGGAAADAAADDDHIAARPALALYVSNSGVVSAVEDRCPHAGHSLSRGDCGDIEDLINKVSEKERERARERERERGCATTSHAITQSTAADPHGLHTQGTDPGVLTGSVLLSCPAHAYIYDTGSGSCITDKNGGVTRRWEVRVRDVDGVRMVEVGGPMAVVEEKDRPVVEKEVVNRIQLALVEKGLDRKYGAA